MDLTSTLMLMVCTLRYTQYIQNAPHPVEHLLVRAQCLLFELCDPPHRFCVFYMDHLRPLPSVCLDCTRIFELLSQR